MTIEKTIAAALEPLAESLAALETKVAAAPTHVDVNLDDVAGLLLKSADFIELVRGRAGADGQDGEPGEPGAAGEKGAPGADGIGADVPLWAPGIYRADSVVQHDLGCLSIALKDTNETPGAGADWQRLGAGGFRWCGVKQDGRAYRDGDLYIDNGTTFLFLRDKGVMFAKRGKDGADGKHGRDGKDAAQLIEARVLDGFKTLALVLEDGRVIECPIPEMSAALTALRDQLEAIKAELSDVRGMLEGATHGN